MANPAPLRPDPAEVGQMAKQCAGAILPSDPLVKRFAPFRRWAPAADAADWLKEFALPRRFEASVAERVKRDEVSNYDEGLLDAMFQHAAAVAYQTAEPHAKITMDPKGILVLQDIEVARRLGVSLHDPKSLVGRRSQAERSVVRLPKLLEEADNAIRRRCRLEGRRYVGNAPIRELRAVRLATVTATSGIIWQFTPFVWWLYRDAVFSRSRGAGLHDIADDLEAILLLLEREIPVFAEVAATARPEFTIPFDVPARLAALGGSLAVAVGSGSILKLVTAPPSPRVGPIPAIAAENLRRLQQGIPLDANEDAPHQDDADYRPASWFNKGMAARLRMAARPTRKTKRVATRRIDGVVCYSVSDVRRWWADMLPKEP